MSESQEDIEYLLKSGLVDYHWRAKSHVSDFLLPKVFVVGKRYSFWTGKVKERAIFDLHSYGLAMWGGMYWTTLDAYDANYIFSLLDGRNKTNEQ